MYRNNMQHNCMFSGRALQLHTSIHNQTKVETIRVFLDSGCQREPKLDGAENLFPDKTGIMVYLMKKTVV